MNVKVTVEVEDNGRMVQCLSGEAEYFGVSIDKVYINSLSFGKTNEAKQKAKEMIKEISNIVLRKML